MIAEQFFIDGLKVQVHDDVVPESAIARWFDFYKNRAQFSYNKIDNKKYNVGDTHFLQCQVDFKTSQNIFDFYSWLPDLLSEFNPSCEVKHYHSSYINILLNGDQFTSHSDIDELNDESFYIGCIWFGNPTEPNTDCGFKFDNKIIDYKFNRMIMFDGRLQHQPIAPTDSFIRVSYYISFSNAFKMRLAGVQGSNPWNRTINTNNF